ncbi:putative reverse transcriptase, RNA-dependent DNA polymerase [Tanacetum coccineum]
MVVLMLCCFIRIMDPTSSLGRICLGENVYGSSSEKVEGHGNWNAPEYTDTAGSKEMKVTKALSFYKMETDEVMKLCLDYEVKKGNKVVKKELIVALKGELYFVKFNINLKEDDVEPGVIFGRSFMRLFNGIVDFGSRLDGEELLPFVCKMGKSSRNKKRAMENLNLFYPNIGTSSSTGRHLNQEEAAKEALAIRIMLDEIWKDKVELDGMIVKEEEEAINKVKGKALKEKDDPRAFIFPIRVEGKVHVKQNALADTGSDINTMPYRIYEQLGREEIKKVERGITMINHTQAKVMGILTNVLSHVGVTILITKFLILDIPIDRDVPIVVGQGFLCTIGGIVNTPERLFSTFNGFCHQTFRAARSDVMRNAESDSDDEEEYEIKRNKFGAPIYGPKPVPYLNCNDLAERSLAIQIVTNPFRKISVWKKATIRGNDAEAGSSKSKRSRQFEIVEEVLLPQVHMSFCYGEVATMRRSLEPIYAELCHEFYSTYEFDEVCADGELQTKKIIKFRLGGRAHNLTLLEFARRLGLYHADELEEDGFDVYFQGGLRSDEHFNAQEYWLSISREENLGLSRSHTSTIRNPILRANVAWLIARWMKRKGAGTQKESQICCGQFITKIARKARVLTDVVLRSLSALIYCRDLDTTTLRELIDFEGRLIPEDPRPGVPRVGIPRPPRASMQDFVPLHGAYNPPDYAQPQYDQYYQQYPQVDDE